MTLTQASFITKRVIVISIAVLFIGITGKIIFDIGYGIYQRSQPPKEAKPDFLFGQLDPLNLPSSTVSTSDLSYSLDTTTGSLPAMPKVAKVYFVPQSSATLLSADKAKNLAQKLGFSVGPQEMSPTTYRFTDNNGGDITIDVTTDNFHFQRPQTSSSGSNDLLPDPDQIVNNFHQYLSSNDLDHDDLKDGKTNVVYDGPSQSESETATVSLWPKSIKDGTPNGIAIVTPEYVHGLIKAIITKSTDQNNRYVKVDYIYWPVDLSSYGIYPLRPIDQAFSDLKNGKAYIAKTPQNNQVSITSVYLAYYESDQYSKYLQPVYVFEGPQFAAYVLALDNSTPSVAPQK